LAVLLSKLLDQESGICSAAGSSSGGGEGLIDQLKQIAIDE